MTRRALVGRVFRPGVSVAVAAVVLAVGVWPRTVMTHGSITTTVLFDREIVRILESRCVSCHNEGGLSFPLLTYEQTWVQRLSMRTEVLRRHMPPWAAVRGYGEFANDNGLTLRETQFLVSWVEGLGPRNAGSVFLNVPGAQPPAAPVRATAHVGHWMLGEPDLSRPLDTVRIAAGAGDVVRKVVVDLGLTEATNLAALEYMPGDRSAVRAATFTLQGTGQPFRGLSAQGRWLGSWTPWYGFTKLPSGLAHRLPAGAKVVAEIHYRVGAMAVEDRGTLGLHVGDSVGAMAPSDLVLEAKPGASRATTRLAADTTVWALAPDVGPGVTSLDLSARRPDGSTDVLLLAQAPTPQWPTPYILKTPVRLPRGTELRWAVGGGAGARLVVSRY